MKKRLLAGFMACALVLSLLPTAAFAADGDVSYRTCDPDGTNWQTGTKASGEYTAVTADDTEWTSGWYVASGGVTIGQRVTVTGDVHLILEDGCNITINGGISVNEGNSITIYAQSEGGSMGELTANGTNGAYNIGASAGIGGDGGIYVQGVQGKTAGTITIYGGRVTANGGNGGSLYDDSGQAAGIGGGGGGHFDGLAAGGAGGTVNIYGGYVKTTGGKVSFIATQACGIGGGYNSYANNDANGGTINITGGTLSDTTTSTSGTFNMTGGTLDNCKIQNATATTSGNSIAIKNSTVNGTVTVSGNAEFEGTLTFNGAVSVNNASFTGSIKFVSGATITGSATLSDSTELTGDMTISAGGSLTNSGTLTVPAGSTITNHGTITNDEGATINLSGTIDDTAAPYGTLTNNGTIFLISDGRILDSSAITPNAPISSGSTPVPAGEIVIDLSTVTSTVTIGPKEYTIDGTSHTYDPARNVIVLTGEYKGTISGTNTAHAAAVTVLENTTASITLRDVNIGWEKDYTYYCSSIWVKDYCAVTVFLEGNNTLKPKASGNGIRTEEHSSLTVEGTGTLNLDLSNGSTIIGVGHNSNGNFGSITINGGTINETIGSSTNTTWVAAVGGTRGTLVINGGTLKGDDVLGEFQIGKQTSYQCVINGGVINSTKATNINYGSLTINGGEVSMPTVYCYQSSGGSITINGGQVTANKGSLSGAVTLNGGTVTGKVESGSTIAVNGGSAKLTNNSDSQPVANIKITDSQTAYRTVLANQGSVASVLVDGKSQNISYNHPDDPAGTADNNLYLYLVHDENAATPETHTVVVMYQDGTRKEYTATWSGDPTNAFTFGDGQDSTPTTSKDIGMTMTGTTTNQETGKPEKTYGDAKPVVVTVNLTTGQTNNALPPSNGPMLAANSLPYAFKTVILLCTDKNNVTREIERKDVPENQTSVVFYVQTQAWAPGEYKFTATYGGDATTGSSAIAETSAPALNIVGQKLDKNALTVNVAVSGTYGQKVSELAVSGTVTQNDLEIPGTWAVSGVNGDTVLDVGTAQALTATFTPSGKGYDDTLTRTITPTIGKKELTATISGTTSKTYDGNTTATGLSIALADVVSGDTVSATATITYDNANVGDNKTITASEITLTGTDANNYKLASNTATTTGSITKATPTPTTPGNLTATYGQTLADVALPTGWAWDSPTTLVGNIGSNSFSATYTQDNSGNYNTVTQNLTVTVSAIPRTITVTGTANSPTQITLNEAVIDPNGTGGAVSYGKNTTNTAPSDWQTGKEFSGLTADTTYYFFAKVEADGNYAAAVSAGVAISTPAKAVSSIAIATQPTTLTYTSGQTLDLSGLSVTVTYNDSTTGTIEWSDNKLTADPAAGTALTVTGHHGKTVTISYGGQTATTNTLTVTQGTQAVASITGAPATIYNGDSFTLTLSGGSGTGAVTWEIVSGPAKVDATTGKVTVTGTGEIKIKVVKAADTDYTQAEVTITLNATTRPTPPTGGGGGGGGYTPPTYKPDITKPSGGGDTPSVSPSNPKQGDTVTVTPKPDDGHEVGGITVTDKNGKPVEVTQKPDGTYTFKQPNGKVTIEVTYRPIDRPWNNPFSDVSESDWFYEAVKFVHQRGLMNGYNDGRFGPNDNLSRAQLAQILFNKEGRPGVNYLLTFSDVAGEAWYTEAIRWATSQGIVGGYGNGMFGPNDPITREQLAVMLWRYSGSPAATDKELHFADADEISPFALEAMRWAVENGILNGYGDGRLGPQGQATRAQVAQMLKNFIENQEEENT